MKDPYQILGIDRNATDEEVKTAYRNMARKYHPDSYGDNPLADLAEEKMQEINEAYDSILGFFKIRKCLRHADYKPVQPHRVYYHGC